HAASICRATSVRPVASGPVAWPGSRGATSTTGRVPNGRSSCTTRFCLLGRGGRRPARELHHVLLAVERVGHGPPPGGRRTGHRLVPTEAGFRHPLAAGQAGQLPLKILCP